MNKSELDMAIVDAVDTYKTAKRAELVRAMNAAKVEYEEARDNRIVAKDAEDDAYLVYVIAKELLETHNEQENMVDGTQEKREWAGLTDEEKDEAYHRHDEWGECVDWVEAKLKDKNT